MAIYAIGDIHGCYNALTTVINSVQKSDYDTFVFLGDYINRGPKSKQTLDWLMDFSQTNNAVFLRGNHEIMMMVARQDENSLSEWLHFGGNNTLKSFEIVAKEKWAQNINDNYWQFLEQTQPYHQIGKHIFVHAGLEFGKSLDDQNNHNLFWKKYIIPQMYSLENTVICGHTSRKNGEIADFEHTICIDTYAYGGQWLTCLNVNTGEFYQANQEMKLQNGKLKKVACKV